MHEQLIDETEPQASAGEVTNEDLKILSVCSSKGGVGGYANAAVRCVLGRFVSQNVLRSRPLAAIRLASFLTCVTPFDVEGPSTGEDDSGGRNHLGRRRHRCHRQGVIAIGTKPVEQQAQVTTPRVRRSSAVSSIAGEIPQTTITRSSTAKSRLSTPARLALSRSSAMRTRAVPWSASRAGGLILASFSRHVTMLAWDVVSSLTQISLG